MKVISKKHTKNICQSCFVKPMYVFIVCYKLLIYIVHVYIFFFLYQLCFINCSYTCILMYINYVFTSKVT